MEETLEELRRLYVHEGRPLPVPVEARLREDPRIGVRMLLEMIEQRRSARRREGQRLRYLSRFEDALWKRGVELVAGIDEAGMSPLAGPVVAAAVILPRGFRLSGVDDSKKLLPETRSHLAVELRKHAVAWAVGIVEPAEIDQINIYRAGLLAMHRAVTGLSLSPEHLLIDARSLREIPIPQSAIVHGDALSISIAAASIIAKTTRDALMIELDAHYPGYGFSRHKGYPVREHHDAIARLGVLPIHRRSFRAVREALGLDQQDLFLP